MIFDLKNATIFLIDGFSANGAVNLMAGYMTGVVTMTIDGVVGIIPVGATFLVGTDTVMHTVTAHTETSSNTTSITFTPGLGAAVLDNDVITFGGQRLQIKIGDGQINYDEKRVIEYKKDRGLLDQVRYGDQEPMEVKLDVRWEFLRSDTSEPPTPEEALKQIGAASTWISSAADKCQPYAVDILILNVPPCAGVKTERILLQDYRWETLNHDTKQGMLSTSGKCNTQQAVVTRV